MVTVMTSGWMDVPVKEYIPHDCTARATADTTNVMTAFLIMFFENAIII
jgi:hypothetical protein